jgi:hypothetical protein
MGEIIVDKRMIDRCVKGAFRNATKAVCDFLIRNGQYMGWVDVTKQHGSISIIIRLNGPNNDNLLKKFDENLKEIFTTLNVEFFELEEKGNFKYTIN